jgi:hypothetical protein
MKECSLVSTVKRNLLFGSELLEIIFQEMGVQFAIVTPYCPCLSVFPN